MATLGEKVSTRPEHESDAVAVPQPNIPRLDRLEWKPVFSLGILGKALAWGHYFYEAEYGLPDFKRKKETYECHHGVTIKTKQKGILICSKTIKLKNLEKIIEQATNLETIKCAVDSTEDREYFNPVLKLKSPIYNENRPYYIVESPSALETLLQIAQYCAYINITKAKEEYLILQFAVCLYHLLTQNENCKRWFDLTFVESDHLLEILEGNATKSPLDSKVEWAIKYDGVGYALAYFYFFNYLFRIFSDLKKRIENFVNEKIYNNNKPGEKVFVPILFTIVPKSGCTRPRLDDDPNENFIEHVGSLDKHVEYIGLKYRPYTSTVYKIKHPNKKPLYCLAEFSAPARQLYNMNNHHLCGPHLNGIYDEELRNFSTCLSNLIRANNFQDLCHVINYNDNDENLLLSQVLYEQCEQFPNKI